MPAFLPFHYVPMPKEYPGKAIWFTLRFTTAQEENAPCWGAYGAFVLPFPGRTEWVEPAQLKACDRALGGVLVARVELGGQPFWKIDLGNKASRLTAVHTLAAKVERRSGVTAATSAQLEYTGEPATFSARNLESVLRKIHQRTPLSAVCFHEPG